jgi:hypothetical protein
MQQLGQILEAADLAVTENDSVRNAVDVTATVFDPKPVNNNDMETTRVQ